MLRLVVIVFVILSSVVSGASVAAADCELCLDSVALQTRDGRPWSAGQPVTLVLHVASHAAVALPDGAQAVVMQADGDRTKCLGVPLKLVDENAAGGVYAGVFFPFRAARYDGELVLGHDVQDITFDVNRLDAGAAPAAELPAAEPVDTSAPLPTFASAAPLPTFGAVVVALCVLAGVLFGRQRRLRPAA